MNLQLSHEAFAGDEEKIVGAKMEKVVHEGQDLQRGLAKITVR